MLFAVTVTLVATSAVPSRSATSLDFVYPVFVLGSISIKLPEGAFCASSNSFHFPSLASLKSPAYNSEVLYFPYKPISSRSDELLSLASSIRESSTLKLVASTVKLPPLTVKSPATLRLPETDVVSDALLPRVVLPFTVKLLNVTLLVVPTSCPILMSPEEIVTPVPPLKCALVSEALGPV